jgi:hypothetical protein
MSQRLLPQIAPALDSYMLTKGNIGNTMASNDRPNEIIDYAYPMMMAEKHLRLAHDKLLLKQLDAAIEELLKVATETKIAINSVNHMKEHENAIRKQTTPIQARVRDIRWDSGSEEKTRFTQ